LGNDRGRLGVKMTYRYIKKIREKKICPICNKEFLTKKGQVTCSTHCSQVNYRKLHPKLQKNRYRLDNQKREKVCKWCKKPFYDMSYANTKKFCCENHSRKYYKEHILKPIHFELKKIRCIICKNYFLPERSIRSDLPFCSKECIIKHLLKFDELGYILGVIASDGFITNNKKQLGMTVKDKDYAEYFCSCLNKIFPSQKIIRVLPHSDGRYRVYLTRIKIVQALSSLFDNKTTTFNWIVPKIVLENKKLAKQFLNGFFDGEATVNTQREKYVSIQCYSANENGLREVGKLLSLFKINYTTSKLNRKGVSFISRKDNNKTYSSKSDIYAICINKFEDIKRFYNQIGFKIKRKQDKLKIFVENFTYEVLPWNEEDSELLKNKSLTARELSKKLDVTINRIKNRRRFLGISFWKAIYWTPEQTKMLKDNYGEINNQELSIIIGKPVHCLISKMCRLRKTNENNQ